MTNTNKINLTLWVVFLALFICAPAWAQMSWDITLLGYGTNPQIHGKNIVWQSGGEIFFYDATDGGTAVSISSDSYNNSNPQIYGNYICWEGFDNYDDVYKIFLDDGIECIALDLLDGTSPQAPQVSDKLVVWYASDGTNDEIYAYDIGDWSTDKLTNDDYDNQNPQVSGYNVTWEARKDAGTLSLFFYDALDNRKVMVREQLSVDNWHPQIYDDTIAWWGGVIYPAPDYYKLELFMFDESDDIVPVQITDYYASTTLVYPQIWGKNIVWEGLNRSTIDFYDGITQEITHISNPCLLNKCPQVWDNKVVWEGITVDYNYEIYFWDGDTDTTYNLSSTSSAHDQAPQIYNCDVVWYTDTGFVYFAEAVSSSNINVSPLSYDFGEVWVGSTSVTTVTISNEGAENLTVSDIYLQLDRLSDFTLRKKTGLPLVLEPDESVELTIIYKPSSPGLSTDVLEIISDDPEQSFIEVDLSGTGIFFVDIEVSPMAYDFGEVQLDTTAITVVTISSTGNLSLDVNSIDFQEGSSGDFSIVSAPELPFSLPLNTRGRTADIEIAFKPLTLGPASAVLEIGSNDPDENPIEIELSGTGI